MKTNELLIFYTSLGTIAVPQGFEFEENHIPDNLLAGHESDRYLRARILYEWLYSRNICSSDELEMVFKGELNK